MVDITRYPQGLLDLLGLQSQGENPRSLSPAVVATVDVSDLYGIGVLAVQNTQIAVPANGINVAFTVPTGEVWRVFAGGAFANCGVGVSMTLWPAIDGVVNIGPAIAIAASTQRPAIAQVMPVTLRSGQTLTVNIAELVGVPALVTSAYLVARLRA